MEVEVRRVASSDVGFVALPLHIIYMLQQSDAQISAFLVLELRDSSSNYIWFVAWTGASSQSSCIEVPENLAVCIGLPDHARVNVRVRIDVPQAQTVSVEPATEDDSEILGLHAEYLETHILNQVGVLQEGRRFPVSVPGQGILNLLAKSTSPRSVVKLARGTELIVSVKKRVQKTPPQIGREIWLRVQNLDESLYQPCKLGNREYVIVPTATVYVSPSTAARVGVQNGQWILAKSCRKRTENKMHLTEEKKPVKPAKLLRLIYWEGVCEGHVMVSKPLRQFLNAQVHAGLYIQSFQKVDVQHAAFAKISPVVFCPDVDKPTDEPEINNTNDLHSDILKNMPAEVFKAWIATQTKCLLGAQEDETIRVATESIICFKEAGSDTELNVILSLEGKEVGGEDSYLLDVMGIADDQKVQRGQFQYVKSFLDDEKLEVKMPSFESVWVKGMANDALQRLTVLLTPISRRKIRSMELPTPSGVLLHGPNACGKTQLSLALARELSRNKQILAHWVYIKCAELVGEAENKLKNILKDAVLEAVEHAPCLVILDDLDALVPVNEGSTAVDLSTTALAEYFSDLMDTAKETAPVAFLATASGPKALPLPLRSSGRFAYNVELEAPGVRERTGILKEIISSRGLQCPEDIMSKIAASCDGYDANDLEIIVDRALHASAARVLSTKDNGHISKVSHKDTNEVLHKDQFNINEVPRKERFYITESEFNTALQGFVPAALKGVAKAGLSGVKLGWEDIGGLPEVRRTLKELLELPVKFPKLFANAPLRVRTGVLLYGPPGCGKTHTVAAAASACSLRFIPVKGPELLDKYIGASEKAVRDVFARASAAAPCILFFDEFDAIAPKRGHDNTGVTDRVVNQLLAELDGVSALSGVFTFAATNRPDLIDAALLRPGRLDHLLFCDFPTESERLDILRVLSRHLPMENGVDLTYIARRSEGFSGADLKAVLSDAELEAVHLTIDKTVKRPLITMEILKSSLAKAIPLQEAERRRFANIYKAFTGGRSSTKDIKGKKATLA